MIGGVELAQLSEGQHSPTQITWRAILLGTLLIPVNIYWLTIVEIKYNSLDGSSLPLFVQPVFLLFALVLINLVLKRLRPNIALTQVELLIIYMMVAVSSTTGGWDSFQNLFGSIGHPFWFATIENEWEDLFFRYLPDWLMVSDKKSLQDFYKGESTFYTLYHFYTWVKPLAFWGLFFLVLMFMMFCINTIIRKRWAEEEKLAYPVIQLPLGLSENSGVRLLKNRMMWIGFGIAAAIGVINGIHFLYPLIPGVPYIKATRIWPGIFSDHPWTVIAWIRVYLYPFGIGLAFFLPIELLLSCWFFFAIRMIERVIGAATGAWHFPQLNEQSYGAWIAIFCTAIWVTRRHLIEVGKKVVRIDSTLDDSDEPMPYRWAVFGILGSIIFIGIFTSAAGMAVWVAACFFGFYFILAVAITRVRAEVGTPHELLFVSPQLIMTTVFGTRRINSASLTIIALFAWFNRGYRSHPMPNQIEAFKIANATGMRYRGFLGAMLIAAVVGIVASFWANLDMTFRDGVVTQARGAQYASSWRSFGLLRGWLLNPSDADTAGTTYAIGGAAVSFFIMFMRMRFLWWPFHPAGYALATSYAMDYFWSVCLVTWVLKSAILRYGGLRAHRRVAPLFLGLILGDYVIGSLWTIIGMTFGIQTYKIFI